MPSATENPNTIATPAPQASVIAGVPCATRRSLLASLGGVVVASPALAIGAPSATGHPDTADAAFIALCAELEAVQRRINGKWTQGIGDAQYRCANYLEESDDRILADEPLDLEIDTLLEKLEDIGKPNSLPAMQALARCILLVDPEIRASATTERRTMHHNPVQMEVLLAWLLGALTDGAITDATCMDAPGYLVSEEGV